MQVAGGGSTYVSFLAAKALCCSPMRLCGSLIINILQAGNLIITNILTNIYISSLAPPMLYNGNISMTAIVGSSLTLPCNVRPEMNLTFTWFFQGLAVSMARILPSGALSIPSVSVSQEGTYTCLVSNQLGSAQEYVTLTVQGRHMGEWAGRKGGARRRGKRCEERGCRGAV